eukprot:gene10341-21577_t
MYTGDFLFLSYCPLVIIFLSANTRISLNFARVSTSYINLASKFHMHLFFHIALILVLLQGSIALPNCDKSIAVSNQHAVAVMSKVLQSSEISGQSALVISQSSSKPSRFPLKNTLKLGFYFFVWYALNIVYGITNKRVLTVLPLPTSIAVLQLFIGIPVFLPAWFFKRPIVSRDEVKAITKIAALHGLGNIASVVSFGAGAVSFTHIVKAAEPVFTAVFSAMFLGNVFPVSVYLSLLVIILGVALASLSELSFTWLSLNSAMISNACYQLRVVLSKKELGGKTKLNSATLFRLITLFAAFELLPIAIFFEGSKISSIWNAAISSGINQNKLLLDILISGISYYVYNEVSFWILAEVHPITHAVGNCIKRVVVIIASVIILNTRITSNGILGSAIAVLGTFLYSMAQLAASGGASKPSVSF